MKPVVIKPQKEQKTVWLLNWLIWSIVIILPLVAGVVFIPDIHGQIAVGIVLAVFVFIIVLWGIWIPYFFNSLEYIIDADTVKMNSGVFWKKRVNVPFRKITNVDINQGPLQRMYNVGSIHVQTAGAGGAQGAKAELRFTGIRKLEELKEIIMSSIRGNAVPRKTSELQKSERTEINSQDILKEILNELRAIRFEMKKR